MSAPALSPGRMVGTTVIYFSAVNFAKLLPYGILGLPLAFAALPIYVHLPRYYAATTGVDLASLGFIGLHNIHEMNTLKTLLGSLLNLVAAIWFVCAGLIDWHRAGVMTVGALAGYFLGSHYSQRIPQPRVRQLITLIGFVISAVTFYKEFLR